MTTGTINLGGGSDEQTVDTFSKTTPGVVYWYLDLSNIGTDDKVEVREEVNINGTGFETHISYTYDSTVSETVVSQSNNLMVHDSVEVRIVVEQTAGDAFDVPYTTGVKF